MNARINPYAVSPDGYKALMGLEQYLSRCEIEKMLLHLIELSSSQGCDGCSPFAWICIGKICGQAAKRSSGCMAWMHGANPPTTPTVEQGGMEWTEAVTLITQGHVPDEIYESARKAIQRKRTERSDHRGGGDQCVESPGDFAALGAGKIFSRRRHTKVEIQWCLR